MELHTIELNKFTDDSSDELADIVAKTKNALDMWVAFLTRHDLLKADRLPKELDNDTLKKALHVLDVLNFSEEERELYEDHLKWLRIEANTLKKATEKAREEALTEGISIGVEKTAINMLKQKLDDKLISSVTGLTLEEILKLKNKN